MPSARLLMLWTIAGRRRMAAERTLRPDARRVRWFLLNAASAASSTDCHPESGIPAVDPLLQRSYPVRQEGSAEIDRLKSNFVGRSGDSGPVERRLDALPAQPSGRTFRQGHKRPIFSTSPRAAQGVPRRVEHDLPSRSNFRRRCSTT